MSKELKEIIEQLNTLGSNSFYDGIDKKKIIDFEDKNNIRLPDQLKEFYLFSDGGEFFLPAGLQLYGILRKPIIDPNNIDRPSEKYVIIGNLSNGDPILCNSDNNEICIYNHEADTIENDEIYPDFKAFLSDLPNILGV